MVAGRTEVYFDPYDVGINEDPYPVYQRLREEAPAYSNERYGFWALSRHADVEAALVDWRTYTSTRSDILDVIRSGVELPPGVIMFEDPPLHTMHRGLMARVLTPVGWPTSRIRSVPSVPAPSTRWWDWSASTSSPSSAR